ncbi:bacteriocin immunity protein [Lacticaseibacillus pabuli]|uniref:Bacteriocin immunity protein n=1 Tax=Lacticaseibacillus pabuli TaxID=3025672 RepID=A0ABY7WUP9_9LACO|nr:bacteriocin immunity protein [Lacticaseibacillus sp. KACC 23028]WDF83851.1 bacteriocin immunity protein [Lacticaseibacillus sp. KACC 23028]
MQELSSLLVAEDNQSPQMLDIIDVLGQVSKRLDKVKDPAPLINRLVNYIRISASNGRLDFSKDQEKLMIELGYISQKAGRNGLYMADFSDKSQFYGFTEQMPIRTPGTTRY